MKIEKKYKLMVVQYDRSNTIQVGDSTKTQTKAIAVTSAKVHKKKVP